MGAYRKYLITIVIKINVKNILHYLDEYINKEMKTIFYKTKFDKRLDLEFIVYKYATGLAYSWLHIFIVMIFLIM